MTNSDIPNDSDWVNTLQRLSRIREQDDYSSANVDFVRECLLSSDERIRGGAALAAAGCLFEQHIIDLLTTIAEEDEHSAVRKAALQSLEEVIAEGVRQGLEDRHLEPEDMEEWEEFQTETLEVEYQRVKNLLLGILQNDEDETDIRAIALLNLSSLGFSEYIRYWISEFYESPHHSSQIAAVKAMGKYPQYWERELADIIHPATEKALLMEAISSSYSSDSPVLAQRIQQVVTNPEADVEIICYCLPTLANINRTENLGELLQEFSLHADEKVQQAAKDALEAFSRKSFDRYLQDELGMDDLDI